MMKRQKGNNCIWWRDLKLLQKHHMKNIVNTSPWWQVQTVCKAVNALQDLLRPVEPRGQLPSSTASEGRRQPTVKVQPHPIAYCELQRSMSPVILSFHQFLAMEKAVADLC
jgi:hypothetical protein